MKKIFTLLFLAIIVTAANAETVSKKYSISDPVIKNIDSYKTITFSDMILSGKAGEPALPWYAVKLMLPPGQEAVNIRFEGSDLKTLDGFFKIYPSQPSRPLSVEQKIPFSINNKLYNSSASYPESQTGQLSTHFMNGYAYALSTFTPINYNPQKGTVSYYQTVTITIETVPTDRAGASLSNLPINDKVRNRCLVYAQNSEMAAQYPSPGRSSTHYDILIITPQSFSSQFQGLINHYRDQGLIAHISTTEFIGANFTGIDMPEKMRNHIISEYQNNGISQVILGGDVEHVAYRGFYCAAQSSVLYEDANIPSDLYFSGLDGNWNTDGDQLWAEIGEDDLLPDISVGRMSFSNSTELAAMINKTIQYQSHPIEGELNNHLLAGESLYDNPETWGSDYLEMLIGYKDGNGYTTIGIPESYPTYRLYDEIVEWTPGDLINTINSGKSFINHVGHANENYTMKLYNWDITNQNFSGVNGIIHNFPIVYTHGCICGAFDVNDCIAERMVAIENFAAAFVGNSRYGWFNEGQTEGPSAHLNREFIDALFTDSINRIGSAHLESKIATAPWVNAPGQWEEGALRWCFYDCNVLGDPAMAMWSNEVIPIATVYPHTIPIDSTSFTVTVTSMSQPVGGLTVALVKDEVLIGTGITNANGVANVVFDTIVGEGSAQIKISGYNCKVSTYNTIFNDPSGIKEIDNGKITVFPNPAHDQITVTFNESNSVDRIVIEDLKGKQVCKIDNISGKESLLIPVSGYQPGVYIIHFISDNINQAKKIVIQ